MIYLFVIVFTVGALPPYTVVHENATGRGCHLAIEKLVEAQLPGNVDFDAYCFEVPTRGRGL